MSVDVNGLVSKLASMALATGLFAQVNEHEPDSPAQAGVTAGVWLQSITPAKNLSGLAKTSARVEFTLRLYMPIQSGGNRDLIDPAVGGAAQQMMSVLTADFTLDGETFAVDLLGAQGAPMSAKAGYVDQGGGQWSRIIDISIPLLLADVWDQAAVSGS